MEEAAPSEPVVLGCVQPSMAEHHINGTSELVPRKGYLAALLRTGGNASMGPRSWLRGSSRICSSRSAQCFLQWGLVEPPVRRDMVMLMVMKAVRKKPPLPTSISAAEFKAKCLDLMDSVSETGASIVITKRGRPVAVLAPVRPSRNSLRGIMKGRMQILGDIVSPIEVVWDAER